MYRNNRQLNQAIYRKLRLNKKEAMYVQAFIDEMFLKGVLCGLIPGFILGVVVCLIAYSC